MCKDCSSLKRKEYYTNNKKKIIEQTSNYKKNKCRENSLYSLEKKLRSRIYIAFTKQNLAKYGRTWKYIGCSPEFFQKWIEFQFYDGMTMENYGKIWHIDHVIPCSKFDLSDKNAIKECFSWKNLRPLLAHKNRQKHNKIDIYQIVLQELKLEDISNFLE